MDPTMNAQRPVTIGLIHAEWCGHCRRLMPIWNKMRTSIDHKPYHPPPQYMIVEQSNLGELDRFNNENSAYLNNQRVQHDGFPTIFKIKDGKIEYYKNSRDPVSLERWFMGRQHHPPRPTFFQHRMPLPQPTIAKYRIMIRRRPKMAAAKTKRKNKRSRRRLRRTISNRSRTL